MTGNAARRHVWLELLQQSGPFLTVPVADRIWPAGLPAVPAPVRTRLRAGVSELLATLGRSRQEFSSLVFGELLGWGDALAEGGALPAALTEVVPEHGVLLRPDFAFRFEAEDPTDEAEAILEDPEDEDEDTDGDRGAGDPGSGSSISGGSDSEWRMLGMWVRWGCHPLSRYVEAGWAASPVERLAALLRARDVPIGLVSDGRWWSLVWAPRGKPVGAAVWDANLWIEEPDSLEAFVAVLDRRRFLGVPPAERVPALLALSAEAQEDVTTALGSQVRTAVEMLVTRLDELDRHADGAILSGVSDDDLYAGVVTVMMRVVFLLFAEERRLLPSDDARYDSAYSVARLVEQLERRAALNGEQTLEHRTGAWHRMLALARALHGGVAHEDLRLPPYGGGLFDPDRFPWLEGRDGPPPPVDDLTVLRMLEAVQYVRLHGERRRLTFRALDVEQIGYVYEGLLELEVRTAKEPVLRLRKQGHKGLALVSLSDAVDAVADLVPWVASTYIGEKKATPARRATAERRLAEPVPAATLSGLRNALGNQLACQLEPLAALLSRDERDRPEITRGGGRFVAPSTRRASTGAHYTPRSLAEEVVQHALEPLIYRPGPLGSLDRSTWVLRPSTDLLTLRIADIAMGSGAFLVAACRFLADRVVEAWEVEGDVEATRALVQRTMGAADAEIEGAPLRARRLVAEHCLYGVDVNPLAVEMAKLSLWLVTMDRERPFGFLDDRFVCGDSLLGLTSMDQLATLHVDPAEGRRVREGRLDYSADWRNTLAGAADTRRRITATPVVTVRDVEHKMRLLDEARAATTPLATVADALTGAGLQAATSPVRQRQEVFTDLDADIWDYEANGDTSVLDRYRLPIQGGLPSGKEPRRTLHWPLTFPEIFADAKVPGFDAIIGNPPFLGGRKISGLLGDDYLAWLATWDGRGVKGSTDLAARFVLRADALLSPTGQLGYVTTNTLLEGATLKVGLLQLEQRGWTVRRGVSSHAWPSTSANLSIVEVWASKAPVVASPVLDGEPVPKLSVDLQPYLRETGRPDQLDENDNIAFQGHLPLGNEFTMTPHEARELLDDDPENETVLFPFVIGADLNRRPDASASRWIVNFREWDEDRARLYVGPWNRLERDLKPNRIEKNATKYPRMVYEWWKYWRYRQPLESVIEPFDHVLAISLVGNTLLPVRVPTGQVFSHACGVFALEDYASLALLSSSTHLVWAIRYTSTMRTDIRYALSDVFLTFPRPGSTAELHELGETFDNGRRHLLLDRALGLTKLYNQVHDPAVTDAAIVRLRELHEQIDHAVLRAYGWTDLDPEIGHHPTKIGTRWTFSPHARFEVLDRLLVENHRRAVSA